MLAPKESSAGFEAWPALDELFPTAFQGVNPNRGLSGSLLDPDRAQLTARMAGYLAATDFEAAATIAPGLAAPRSS